MIHPSFLLVKLKMYFFSLLLYLFGLLCFSLTHFCIFSTYFCISPAHFYHAEYLLQSLHHTGIPVCSAHRRIFRHYSSEIPAAFSLFATLPASTQAAITDTVSLIRYGTDTSSMASKNVHPDTNMN